MKTDLCNDLFSQNASLFVLASRFYQNTTEFFSSSETGSSYSPKFGTEPFASLARTSLSVVQLSRKGSDSLSKLYYKYCPSVLA